VSQFWQHFFIFLIIFIPDQVVNVLLVSSIADANCDLVLKSGDLGMRRGANKGCNRLGRLKVREVLDFIR
jgi:hypothetical protein